MRKEKAMNLVALRGATGVVILFLGRELSFLFAGAMAALIGTRLTYLLPATWPSWAEPAFLAALAVIAAVLTLLDKKISHYVTGFLVGGFLLSEFYAPGSPTIPVLPFFVGSVLGSVSIGLLGEWGMILISCLVGTYLIYGVLPLIGITKTLATAGVFVVGAIAQVIIFQMQKHSDR